MRPAGEGSDAKVIRCRVAGRDGKGACISTSLDAAWYVILKQCASCSTPPGKGPALEASSATTSGDGSPHSCEDGARRRDVAPAAIAPPRRGSGSAVPCGHVGGTEAVSIASIAGEAAFVCLESQRVGLFTIPTA